MHDSMVWIFDGESEMIRVDDPGLHPVSIDPVKNMRRLIYEGPLNPLEDPNLVLL